MCYFWHATWSIRLGNMRILPWNWILLIVREDFWTVICGILCAICLRHNNTETAAITQSLCKFFFITSCTPFYPALILCCKNSQSNRLNLKEGVKYLALRLQNVASFIAGGYISLETHKLWNVRILCILIECGTVNGSGNSATWRLIPLCAVSQPSPWASIKWQNGPILENNNNKNTSLYGNNIRSHLESTMVTACKWLNRDTVIRAETGGSKWDIS